MTITRKQLERLLHSIHRTPFQEEAPLKRERFMSNMKAGIVICYNCAHHYKRGLFVCPDCGHDYDPEEAAKAEKRANKTYLDIVHDNCGGSIKKEMSILKEIKWARNAGIIGALDAQSIKAAANRYLKKRGYQSMFNGKPTQEKQPSS